MYLGHATAQKTAPPLRRAASQTGSYLSKKPQKNPPSQAPK